jgi:GNAT superfamily N-acetyltransferase
MEKNSFAIQKVDDKTFDDFLKLIEKLAEYEKLTPPDEAAKQRLRADCLSDKPKYEAFIGKVNGKSVSYIMYYFTYSSFLARPTFFLEDLFVLKEFRRQGIGAQMLGKCREIAEQNGCGRIEFIVLKWNKSAQRFYEENKVKRLDWFFYRMVSEDF